MYYPEESDKPGCKNLRTDSYLFQSSWLSQGVRCNQVYPRKWNHEFIDLPVVEQSEQNRPSFSSEIMTGLAKYRRPREQMLFVLASAGGLRIGEALGIEIDKHLSADCLTITVEQKARRGRVEHRVKTGRSTFTLKSRNC